MKFVILALLCSCYSEPYRWQPTPVREHLLVCQGIRSAFTGDHLRYNNCMEGFGYTKVEVAK